jgi:O-antigen/teichoic acid export membrane protein
MMRALGGLTAVGAVTSALALITGPLQARLLGPTGRGELAVVLLVTGVAPFIFGLGLNVFVAREVASGAHIPTLFGTTTLIGLCLGALGFAVALPTARLVDAGSAVVHTLLLVGFALLPVAIAGQTLMGYLWGREQWRLLSLARLLSQLCFALALVIHALVGEFSVTSVALSAFAIGVIACAPVAPLLTSVRSWRGDRTTTVRALRFGVKATASTLANQGNQRLDQLLIAGFVSTRDLGLYVVAVTLSTVGLIVVTAINYIVLPAVARGSRHSIKPVLRLTLAGITATSVGVAAAAPFVVPFLFGEAFRESVPLVQVLALGTVFLAGVNVLTSGLVADNRPGEAAWAEGLALIVTVVTLTLLLPRVGTMGAAIASVLAYGASFAFLLQRTRHHFGGSALEYLIVRRADLAQVGGVIASRRNHAPSGEAEAE